MARPQTNRVPRSTRLPAALDAKLVKIAETRGLSVNEALAEIVRDAPTDPARRFAESFEATVIVPPKPPPAGKNDLRLQRDVSPRWKAGMK